MSTSTLTSTFRIDFVEAALIGLLKANLADAYGSQVDIDSLGDDDYNENGQLILQPPSVRVRCLGAKYDALRDNRRLTYQPVLQFEILCFESSLRSKADERKQTLVLVGNVQDQLAGALVNLDDGTRSMPITILDVSLVETDQGPVDQLFALRIGVEGIAQFSGVNAQL